MAAQNAAIHRRDPDHVPAWKKLGLKLKFAKELPQRSALRSTQKSDVNDRKRKRDSTANNEPPKKKRVSFDAAAKEGDGSSAKDLMLAWESRENQLWSQIPKDFDQPMRSKTTKTRKSKKTKKPKAITQTVEPTSSAPYSALAYLQEYHTSRTSWKFSKKKETWLLKHILSLDHIPSSYDQALRVYVSGLKSQAAKERVRAAAEEFIKQDERTDFDPSGRAKEGEGQGEEMEDPAIRKRYYDAALARYIRQLEESIDRADEEKEQKKLDKELRKRLAKRKRAESVLSSAGGSDRDGSQNVSRTGFKRVKLDHEGHEPVKKRNNRTAVVEISSSSDDDSSSDNSSGSDDSESDSDDNLNADSASNDDHSESEPGSSSEESSSNLEPDSESSSEDEDDEETSSTSSTQTISRPQTVSGDSTSESESTDDTSAGDASSKLNGY